jgi:S-DNA-T family DNA segregation ATPase FtsK/SpoIIIE
VLRLADPADAATTGVRPSAVAGLPTGRGVLASCGLSVQLARTSDLPAAIRSIAARWAGADRVGGASAVLRLPTSIAASDLAVANDLVVVRHGGRTEAEVGSAAWTVPIGMGDAALEPVSLAMHPGDHFLIAGPARSGRSSALVLLAEQLHRADPSARVLALAPRHSPLATSPDVEAVCGSTEDLDGLVRPPGVRPVANPTVAILVDDAELVDDPSQALARLLDGSDGRVHVIAAGRVDGLRAAYGHWTQMLRRQRRGLILRPEADLDGDVLGVLLPRWESTPAAPGRGYLVADGECTLVQLAFTDLSRATRPG